MAPVEVSPRQCLASTPGDVSGCDADHRVIRLRGAHDASTMVALCLTIARAIAADDTDLVIDLSEVTFMDAATVGVMIRAEAFLRARSRSLTLRSPPARPRRALSLGGLADLVDPRPPGRTRVMGTGVAPAGRVEVLATDGADQRVEGTRRR
jgi:anti-anti-sigma factor